MFNGDFTYKALDAAANEIRLLRIKPSCKPEPLQCSLAHFPLENSVQYTALSYAWKESKLFSDIERLVPQSIDLNGQSFHVGHNLRSALEHFRTQTSDWFWIDAICINQNNIEERGEQVLRMRSIYSKAQTVLVWLGHEAQNSNEAVDLIETVAQLYDSAEAAAWISKTVLDQTHSRAWLAVHHLLERNWWTRVWVIQEAAVATSIEVVVGEKRLSWKCVEEFVEVLSTAYHDFARLLLYQEQFSIDANALNALTSITSLRKRHQIGNAAHLPILDILVMALHSRSSDERDRIYGIVGLATDCTILKPDYTLSARDIFVELAKGWIQASRKLDIILIDARARPEMQLPSWVPDWGCKSQGCIRINDNWSHAALQTVADVAFSPTNSLLTCKGVYFDEINGCGYDFETPRTDPLGMVIPPDNSANAYITHHETVDALWRSIVGNKARYLLQENEAPKEFGPIFTDRCREVDEILGHLVAADGDLQPFRAESSQFERWYQRNCNFVFAGQTLRSWVFGQKWDPNMIRSKGDDAIAAKESLEATCMHICWKRRLITTSKGFVGHARHEIRLGDKICVLWGCPAPVVMRQVGDHHHLLGECYVHGIMQGEALEMVKEVSSITMS